MSRKTKARPEPGKENSPSSISAPCASCGKPIHIGDRMGQTLVPVGVTFDGELIGYQRMICGACLDAFKASDEGRERIAEAISANCGAAPEGVTLQ